MISDDPVLLGAEVSTARSSSTVLTKKKVIVDNKMTIDTTAQCDPLSL